MLESEIVIIDGTQMVMPCNFKIYLTRNGNGLQIFIERKSS